MAEEQNRGHERQTAESAADDARGSSQERAGDAAGQEDLGDRAETSATQASVPKIGKDETGRGAGDKPLH